MNKKYKNMLFQEHKACETNKEKIIEAQVVIGGFGPRKNKNIVP